MQLKTTKPEIVTLVDEFRPSIVKTLMVLAVLYFEHVFLMNQRRTAKFVHYVRAVPTSVVFPCLFVVIFALI
jgi:hypothetical protein